MLGETQEATLERVRRELQAKQAQYDPLLRAMEAAPPAVLFAMVDASRYASWFTTHDSVLL